MTYSQKKVNNKIEAAINMAYFFGEISSKLEEER